MTLNSHYQETSTLMTSSLSDNGHYIGTESCLESFSDKIDEKREEKKAVASEIAPPPMLSSHVPSVLKREYTSDGRLLLKKEKVSFRAYRSNGRLTLQLVSLYDNDCDSDVKDGDGYHDPLDNGGGNSHFLEGKLR